MVSEKRAYIEEKDRRNTPDGRKIRVELWLSITASLLGVISAVIPFLQWLVTTQLTLVRAMAGAVVIAAVLGAAGHLGHRLWRRRRRTAPSLRRPVRAEAAPGGAARPARRRLARALGPGGPVRPLAAGVLLGFLLVYVVPVGGWLWERGSLWFGSCPAPQEIRIAVPPEDVARIRQAVARLTREAAVFGCSEHRIAVGAAPPLDSLPDLLASGWTVPGGSRMFGPKPDLWLAESAHLVRLVREEAGRAAELLGEPRPVASDRLVMVVPRVQEGPLRDWLGRRPPDTDPAVAVAEYFRRPGRDIVVPDALASGSGFLAAHILAGTVAPPAAPQDRPAAGWTKGAGDPAAVLCEVRIMTGDPRRDEARAGRLGRSLFLVPEHVLEAYPGRLGGDCAEPVERAPEELVAVHALGALDYQAVPLDWPERRNPVRTRILEELISWLGSDRGLNAEGLGSPSAAPRPPAATARELVRTLREIRAQEPTTEITVLVDGSGSMNTGPRLARAREVITAILARLHPRERIGLEIYRHRMVSGTALPEVYVAVEHGPVQLHRDHLADYLRQWVPRDRDLPLDDALRLIGNERIPEAFLVVTDTAPESRADLADRAGEVFRVLRNLAKDSVVHVVNVGDRPCPPGPSRAAAGGRPIRFTCSGAGNLDAADIVSQIRRSVAALRRAG